MAIKIVIQPDLKLMEQLFGGADQISVEFRSSVVQEFARRYLKGLAHDEAITAIGRGIKEEVKQGLREQVGDLDWSGMVKTFAPQFKLKIKEAVLEVIKEQMRLAVQEGLKEAGAGYDELREKIAKEVEYRMKAVSDDIIQRAVKAKVQGVLANL